MNDWRAANVARQFGFIVLLHVLGRISLICLCMDEMK
jgi:hypothetical protein